MMNTKWIVNWVVRWVITLGAVFVIFACGDNNESDSFLDGGLPDAGNDTDTDMDTDTDTDGDIDSGPPDSGPDTDSDSDTDSGSDTDTALQPTAVWGPWEGPDSNKVSLYWSDQGVWQ